MSHCDTKNSQKVSHSDVLVKYNAMQNVQIFIVHCTVLEKDSYGLKVLAEIKFKCRGAFTCSQDKNRNHHRIKQSAHQQEKDFLWAIFSLRVFVAKSRLPICYQSVKIIQFATFDYKLINVSIYYCKTDDSLKTMCNYGADSETKYINGYRIVLKHFSSNSLKSAKPGLHGDTDAESSASCLVD